MISVSITPSSSSDAARVEKLKLFKYDLELFSADQFITILRKVSQDTCIIIKNGSSKVQRFRHAMKWESQLLAAL
jgi:hypothetical protein